MVRWIEREGIAAGFGKACQSCGLGSSFGEVPKAGYDRLDPFDPRIRPVRSQNTPDRERFE